MNSALPGCFFAHRQNISSNQMLAYLKICCEAGGRKTRLKYEKSIDIPLQICYNLQVMNANNESK